MEKNISVRSFGADFDEIVYVERKARDIDIDRALELIKDKGVGSALLNANKNVDYDGSGDFHGGCPTGHESKGGQCFHWYDSDQSGYCWHCNTVFDAVSLYSINEGITSTLSGFEWIQTLLSVIKVYLPNEYKNYDDDLYESSISEEKQATIELKTKTFYAYEKIYDYLKNNLDLSTKPDIQKMLDDYLVSRGYDLNVIKDTEIIPFLNPKKAKRLYEQLIKKTGLTLKQLNLDWAPYNSPVVVAIPYRDLKGQVVGFIERIANKNGEDVLKKGEMVNMRFYSRFPIKEHKKNSLYNLNKFSSESEVIVLEGYYDSAYHSVAHKMPICAMGTASVTDKNCEELNKTKIKSLVLINDNDQVGIVKFIRNITKLISKTKKIIMVVDPTKLGDSKDPDEFIQKNGIDKFKTLVATEKECGVKFAFKYYSSDPNKYHKEMIDLLCFAEANNEIVYSSLVKDACTILGVQKTELKKIVKNHRKDLNLNKLDADKQELILSQRMVVPIGYYNDTYTLYCRDSEQYITKTIRDMNRAVLCSDRTYWQAYCPEAFQFEDKSGEIIFIDDELIKEKLIDECKKTENKLVNLKTQGVGIYSAICNNETTPSVIYNSGSKVFKNLTPINFFEINTRDYIFQSDEHCKVVQEEITNSEFVELLDSLELTNIESKTNAMLLIGGVAASILSGMSPWRSMFWVTGSSGSGKSEIYKYLSTLTRGVASIKATDATEAGLRQNIQNKCTAVFIDEAETGKQVEKIIKYIRQSAPGGDIIKGTPSGKNLIYTARSTFFMFSISESLITDADRERFILIKMRSNGDNSWDDIKHRLTKITNSDIPEKIAWTMYKNSPHFLNSISIIRKAFMNIDSDKELISSKLTRFSDLYSIPLAGFYTLLNKDTITQEDATKLVLNLYKGGYFEGVLKEDSESFGSTAEELYSNLMAHPIPYKGQVFTVEDILLQNGSEIPERDVLLPYGIIPVTRNNVIKIQVRNQNLINILRPYGYANPKIFLELPGAKNPKAPVTVNRKSYKGIEIPFNFYVEEEDLKTDIHLETVLGEF